jgi:hypothetical protein
MNARYKIPVLRPLAGLSPNCWAVLVQIEHWASDGGAKMNEKKKIRRQATNLNFIAA